MRCSIRTIFTIMAKAPQAGRVKTRLIPALGAQGAAALAEKLLLHTADTAAAAAQQLPDAQVQFCTAPQPNHPAWHSLRQQWQQPCPQLPPQLPRQLQWTAQTDGDLGARMLHAVQRSAEQGRASVLLGMDCPALTASHLITAAHALRQYDVVIVPSTDGGYVLLALRTPQPLLFERISWSSEHVLGETLQRIRQAGLTHHLLPPLTDIDSPAELSELPPHIARGLYSGSG